MESPPLPPRTYWAEPGNRNRLVSVLCCRLKYTRHAAEDMARAALSWEPELSRALVTWLSGQTPQCDVVHRGFTLEKLVGSYGMNVPNALNTLNWLAENPDEAEYALARMANADVRVILGPNPLGGLVP